MFLKLVLTMAIAWASESSSVTGSTSLSVPYPSGISAGNMLVLCIEGKSSGATAPTASGFVGAGDNSLIVGNAGACILIREATGSESGNLTVTATDWTHTLAKIIRLTNATGVWDQSECVQGSDTISGGVYSALCNDFDPPDLDSGDYFVVATGLASETGLSPPVTSGHAITATGLTVSSADIRESTDILDEGNGAAAIITLHSATAGSNITVAPTYSFSQSSVNANGATVLLRLREGEGVEPPTAKDWLHYFRQYSGAA